MINFMFCEFLPQNKNVELQEEGKKKTRLEDIIFTFLIKNTFISTISIYTEMGEKLYSGDVQLADSTLEYTCNFKIHFNR